MASKEGRACACAFAFGALRSYRVFVGQNADNVFFSLMVSLRKKKMRCKSFPLLKIYILFREFSLLLACTVMLVGFFRAGWIHLKLSSHSPPVKNLAGWRTLAVMSSDK